MCSRFVRSGEALTQWRSRRRVRTSDGFSRDGLIAAILEFVGEQDLLTLQDIRAALEREIDGAGPDGLLALKARLTSDTGWDYYPPDPLARRVHHLLADRFLDVRLRGGERGRPGRATDGRSPSSPTICRTPTPTSSRSCCTAGAGRRWRIG